MVTLMFLSPAPCCLIHHLWNSTFSGGKDSTDVLHHAGAYGSPLLYGILLLVLVLAQQSASKNYGDFSEETKSLVPDGMVSMSAFAAASVG
eukprot:14368432-Ditylum_brightwellii.AAC.1